MGNEIINASAANEPPTMMDLRHRPRQRREPPRQLPRAALTGGCDTG